MTNDTTTKAPWCPRCGHDLVRAGVTVAVYRDRNEPRTVWTAGCRACGFPHDRQPYTHKDEGEVIDYARRLVRAELGRQALEREMANYELGYEMARFDALTHYEWLGANPLRLPGEGGL